MTTVRLASHVYLRELRVLGAWWRLGSSVLDPYRMVESAARAHIRPADTEDTARRRRDGVPGSAQGRR